MSGEAMHRGSARRGRWAVLLAATAGVVVGAVGLVACDGSGGSRGAGGAVARVGGATRPLVFVAADGLEWDVLLKLMGEGALPNLAALARDGFAAELQTLDVTLSPVIWTTIATGKRPDEHGITDFWYRDRDDAPHLFLSMHRQSKALWNLYDEAGLATDVIGWWCTYPVEPIRGGMVAQTSTRAQIGIKDGAVIWKGSYLKGVQNQVWPPERQPAMDDHAQELSDAIEAGHDPLVERFGKPPDPKRPLPTQLWSTLRTAYYADLLFRAAAFDTLDAAKKGATPPDALLLYLGSVDVATHMFWRYFEPERFDDQPSNADIAALGSVIPAAYRFVDETVGELRKRAPDADLLLLSDHGFHAIAMKDAFPDSRTGRADSGNHQDAPAAALLAIGPSFRKQPLAPGATRAQLKSVGRVEDVLPTLLVRAGLPYATDFAGRPLLQLLAPELLKSAPPRSVATYDDADWRARRLEILKQIPQFEQRFAAELSRIDEPTMEMLRRLGYTGGDPPPPPPPPPDDDEKDRSR